MRATTITDPGNPDAPNEDWVAVTSDTLVILDGATIRTDTGCTHGAAWYARKLGAAILDRAADRKQPLPDVLAGAITDVAALHPECDLTHPGTPSAAVGIARWGADDISWLVLGDVTLLLDTTTGVEAVSDPRISASAAAERAEAHRWPIGSPEKAAALVAMKHVELAARSREYWVAAADPTAVEHALRGRRPAGEIRRIAALTDGAMRWQDLFRSDADPAAILEIVTKMDPGWLIRIVRQDEACDPDGKRYPRNKRSDDATVAVVQF